MSPFPSMIQARALPVPTSMPGKVRATVVFKDGTVGTNVVLHMRIYWADVSRHLGMDKSWHTYARCEGLWITGGIAACTAV